MKTNRLIFAVSVVLTATLIISPALAVTKWACVGDSITAGWKLKEADTYCYKLGVLLGPEYETTNFGHSARTMLQNPVEGWPYWESPMFTASQDYSPDIVSIMLGTNDTHPNNWPELAEQYRMDAIEMVEVYQNLPGNPRVILMTVPPVKDGNSRNLSIIEANALLLDVQDATTCKLADVWSAIETSGLPQRQKFKDPIHLNGPAHTVIADLLYEHALSGGPVCGDAFCEGNEDPCSCEADCGSHGSEELNCTDGYDDDCDALIDCADGDCSGVPECQGGSIIFSDDFESGDLLAGGWTKSGNSQVHTQAAYTGIYGVKLQKSGAMIERAISTIGREGIIVEYDRMTMQFEGSDSFDVEWYDGSNWYTVESTSDTTWGHASVRLPPAASNNSDFKIRFTCNSNHPIEKVYLDNVKVSD